MCDLKRQTTMKTLTIWGLIITLVSCGQTQKSDIEIIKFDIKIIDELQKTSDTTYIEQVGRADFYTIEYFINRKDNVTTKIFKDSLKNVVAHTKSINDKVFFAIEFFPNGQARGKLPEKIDGEYNGTARYYYEDGRVKSEGQFKKGLWSGEWKNYDKNGTLISIDDYGNGNVNPIKTTEVK
jgi:antitoxin component YwqK of YwqJK toxin-antitoxin module